MSYDFCIRLHLPGRVPETVEPRFNDVHPQLDNDGLSDSSPGYYRIGNYTSNVAPIWARCLTAVHDDDEEITLGDLDGRSCHAILPLISAAIEYGILKLDELREMEPDNGWGNAEGAITYLWDIERMCEEHQRYGTLWIGR